MNNTRKNKQNMEVRLGDLICALYEEAEKVTSDTVEQRFMVYAALKNLLGKSTSVSSSVAA